MRQLCWAILLICYYCSSESTIIVKEPGENITLKCSSKGCNRDEKYAGMYLYHNYSEVYYYNIDPPGKITVRSKYKDRVKTEGDPFSHDIIMTNLTVDDSGVYTCVYKESVDKSDKCKIYTVFVRDITPCPGQHDQHILVFIISICVLGMLLIVVFILLIIQKVKQRRSGKIRPRRSMQESSDVYEVMTKSDPCPVSEHSSESPYEFD